MQVELFEVSAFTYNGQGGNLAGVCLIKGKPLIKKKMQATAKALGYSETVFIKQLNKEQFQMSYFTPLIEVPLCGHATIAAFTLLFQQEQVSEGVYQIITLAGEFQIVISDDGTVFMEQLLPTFYEQVPSKASIADSLQLDIKALIGKYQPAIVSTGLKDLLIELKDVDTLNTMQPNMEKVTAISEEYDIIGYHVFSQQNDIEQPIYCRNFAPGVGINEEYATGTSNGALACYLFYENKLENDRLFEFIQGRKEKAKMGRVLVALEAEASLLKRVLVGGQGTVIRKLDAAKISILM